MATINQIKELAVTAAKGSAPENYSMETVNEAFRQELQKIGGSFNLFQKNKYDIFEIIIQAVDEVVGGKLQTSLAPFAEFRQVGEGQKVAFTQPVGKQRAKRFITKAAISGVYETARLDTRSFEIPTMAIGGGMIVDYQRLLDGIETLVDATEVLTEGTIENVYGEVQKALIAATASMPPNNVVSGSYSADNLAKLCRIAQSYGGGEAVILATPEFISAMGADAVVAPTTNYHGIYPIEDIQDIHRTGLITWFRGTPVVPIPQVFADENNNKTLINPQYAYILPSGRDRVVKVISEGQFQLKDFVNRDNSIELHAWKKFGVGIITYNDWCVYRNTSINDTTV